MVEEAIDRGKAMIIDRLNMLAVAVMHQQSAGFVTYVDVREMKCAECGSSGFNTGLGYWQFSCGLEVLSDGDECAPCRSGAAH